MYNSIRDIVRLHKNGSTIGVCSICSSNRYVLETAMRQAKEDGSCQAMHSILVICEKANDTIRSASDYLLELQSSVSDLYVAHYYMC